MFDLDHNSFSLLVKSEFVVLKDYHTLLESIKLAIGKGKSEMLTPKDIPKNIFTVHIDEDKKMDALVLGVNQHVEQEKANCLIKLRNEHGLAIVKIQSKLRIKYGGSLSFQTLLKPALALE